MAVTQVKSKQQLLVTDNVSFQSAYRITNLVDPVAAQDAATKAYVDAVKQALDIKDSARVATTGAETYTISAGAVTQITGTSVDGVTIAVNDRILIKNAPAASGAGAGAGTANTTQPANGIYIVTNATTNLTVQRATDADISADVTAGMFVFVAEGTANADNGYVLTTNDAIVLNTTGLTFTQFSGAGQITAGAGLTKTGNTIDVVGTASRITVNTDSIDIASDYVGQTSITTLGTVTTGTWNATTIATTRGGTGLTSYVLGDILYASAANTLAALAGNTTTSKRFLTQTGTGSVSAAPAWGAITAADVTSGAALTKTDDTNVTLTLGGTPASALLAAVSLTLGWTGTLSAARGGTGVNAGTAANGQLLIGNGSGFTLATLTQGTGMTITNAAGTITIANAGVTSITGTTNQVNASASTGAVTLSLPQNIHTGATPTFAGLTLTAGTVTVSTPYRNSTQTWNAGAVTFTGELVNITDTASAAASKFIEYQVGGAARFAIRKDGAVVTGIWQATAVGAVYGGTGQTSYTIGDLLYADTTTSLAKLADVATGNALISGGVGVAPSWGKIGLATHVSGTLGITNGGTGVTGTPSNGQLLIGNGSGFTLATLSAGSGITINNSAGGIQIVAAASGLGASNFVIREVPTGTVNGSNATFTLANTPTAGTEHVFVNGVLQNVGAGNDYTISTVTITFQSGAIPQSGDVVLVSYMK